jgi:hypothetical protein
MISTKRVCVPLLAGVILVIFSFPALAGSPPEPTTGIWNGEMATFGKGRAVLTVKTDSSFAALTDLCSQYSVSVEKELPLFRMYILTFSDTTDVINLCSAFNAKAQVYHCSPDFAVSLLTSDRYWPLQWHFKNTGQRGGTAGADMMVEEAFSITRGNSAIKLAIL